MAKKKTTAKFPPAQGPSSNGRRGSSLRNPGNFKASPASPASMKPPRGGGPGDFAPRPPQQSLDPVTKPLRGDAAPSVAPASPTANASGFPSGDLPTVKPQGSQDFDSNVFGRSDPRVKGNLSESQIADLDAIDQSFNIGSGGDIDPTLLSPDDGKGVFGRYHRAREAVLGRDSAEDRRQAQNEKQFDQYVPESPKARREQLQRERDAMAAQRNQGPPDPTAEDLAMGSEQSGDSRQSDPMGLMTPRSGPEDKPKDPAQATGRLASLQDRDPEKFNQFMEAAGGDPEKAGELLMSQLRTERGLDKETRQAATDDQQRSSSANSILRRHSGDPRKLRRALDNFNRNNPKNPMRPEDLGLSGATDPSTARPGEVIRVGSGKNVDPQRVAAGAILDTDGGMRRVDQVGDKKLEIPVQRDAGTGFFFPDPDRYESQEAFDGKIRRQDRVNLRQAVMKSNDPVLANAQRRLDSAREAASSSIPEIRDAGLKQVAEQERELHWRYISEKASLGGVDIGQVPDEREIGSTAPEGPTVEEVERQADSLAQRRVSEMRRQGVTMTPERVAEVEQAARRDAERRAGAGGDQFDPSSGIGDGPAYPTFEPDPEQMEAPKQPTQMQFIKESRRIEEDLIRREEANQQVPPDEFGFPGEGNAPPLTPQQLDAISVKARGMARELLEGMNSPMESEPDPVSEMDAAVSGGAARAPAPQTQAPSDPAPRVQTPSANPPGSSSPESLPGGEDARIAELIENAPEEMQDVIRARLAEIDRNRGTR